MRQRHLLALRDERESSLLKSDPQLRNSGRMTDCTSHPKVHVYPTGIDALLAMPIISKGENTFRVLHCSSCLNFYIGVKDVFGTEEPEAGC